jgi:hypothetical protein
MAIFRELDSRKMRDRDASSGDRGNGGDIETLTDGTSVPGRTSGTESASDSGDRGSYNNNARDTIGDAKGNRANSIGAPLPDSGGPDVSDMGDGEQNGMQRKHSGSGMMGDNPTSVGDDNPQTRMDTATPEVSPTDLGTSTGSGGNWGDPGTSTGRGLGRNTTTSGQN